MTTLETRGSSCGRCRRRTAEPFLEIHQDPEVIKYALQGAPPGGLAGGRGGTSR